MNSQNPDPPLGLSYALEDLDTRLALLESRLRLMLDIGERVSDSIPELLTLGHTGWYLIEQHVRCMKQLVEAHLLLQTTITLYGRGGKIGLSEGAQARARMERDIKTLLSDLKSVCAEEDHDNK